MPRLHLSIMAEEKGEDEDNIGVSKKPKYKVAIAFYFKIYLYFSVSSILSTQRFESLNDLNHIDYIDENRALCM